MAWIITCGSYALWCNPKNKSAGMVWHTVPGCKRWVQIMMEGCSHIYFTVLNTDMNKELMKGTHLQRPMFLPQ
jgi:hypothetical protein